MWHDVKYLATPKVLAKFGYCYCCRHTWLQPSMSRQVTYEWVTSRMNESRRIWMSHVAWQWVMAHKCHTWLHSSSTVCTYISLLIWLYNSISIFNQPRQAESEPWLIYIYVYKCTCVCIYVTCEYIVALQACTYISMYGVATVSRID